MVWIIARGCQARLDSVARTLRIVKRRSESQLELFSPERRHAGRRIEAYFSDDLERLARKLFASITGDTIQDRYDPFAPPLVLVPNRNLRRWLQMRMAREDAGPGARGVCAHVNFQFLEEGFFTILTELDPARERPRLLTDDHVIFAILGVFADDETMQAADLGVLRNYLRRGARSTGVAERRAYQLARRLAGLFREYEFHRHIRCPPGSVVRPSIPVPLKPKRVWVTTCGPCSVRSVSCIAGCSEPLRKTAPAFPA